MEETLTGSKLQWNVTIISKQIRSMIVLLMLYQSMIMFVAARVVAMAGYRGEWCAWQPNV